MDGGVMGTRSDVGVAMQTAVVEKLPEDIRAFLDEVGEAVVHPDGTLWVIKDVKWYVNDDEDIQKLYSWLDEQEHGDYLCVEACSEYPDSDDGDAGTWTENPWGVRKEISVSLEYTDPTEAANPGKGAGDDDD